MQAEKAPKMGGGSARQRRDPPRSLIHRIPGLHGFGTNLVANGIAFGNNTFVAVGNGSVILQSDTTGGPNAAPPSLAIGQVPNLTITGERAGTIGSSTPATWRTRTGFSPRQRSTWKRSRQVPPLSMRWRQH